MALTKARLLKHDFPVHGFICNNFCAYGNLAIIECGWRSPAIPSSGPRTRFRITLPKGPSRTENTTAMENIGKMLSPVHWKKGKDPHPQDKIQHLDFTKDPRPLYYKTPPCVFYHKNVRSKAVFRSLVRTKFACSKMGRFLSKAEILGVGVLSPLPGSIAQMFFTGTFSRFDTRNFNTQNFNQ